MIKILIIAAVLGAVVFVPICLKGKRMVLKAGDKAPSFRLQDETGIWRTLEEFRGKKVVVYFYPKDDTPGCTAQACSFRDNAGIYAQHDIVVLGVSYDTPASHALFKEKFHLPFILLADTTHEVAKAYGAASAVPILNRFFANRITFLIDEQGNIIKTLSDIDVATYAVEVLKDFGIKS